MRYPHIVFDMDGTLVNSEDTILQSLQDTLIEFTGSAPPKEELIFSLGITGMDTALRFPQVDPDAFLARWEELLSRIAHSDRLYDGIPQLLQALREEGCTLGIATSRTHAELDADLERFGLAGVFGHIVCADECATHKPQPGPLLKYMELAQAQPHQVLYLGDSAYDCQCAHGAGVDFALATWGAHDMSLPASFYPATPLELAGLLR